MKTHKGLQWGTAVAVVAFRAMFVSNAVADHNWFHHDRDSQGYNSSSRSTYWRSGESLGYSSESPRITGTARGGALDLQGIQGYGNTRTIEGTYTSTSSRMGSLADSRNNDSRSYSGGTGEKSYNASTYSDRGSANDRSQMNSNGEVIQIPPDVVHIESDRGNIRFSRIASTDWNRSQNVSRNNNGRPSSISSDTAQQDSAGVTGGANVARDNSSPAGTASINSPNSGGAPLGSSGSISSTGSSSSVTTRSSDNYPAANANTSNAANTASSTSSTGEAREAAKGDAVHTGVGDQTASTGVTSDNSSRVGAGSINSPNIGSDTVGSSGTVSSAGSSSSVSTGKSENYSATNADTSRSANSVTSTSSTGEARESAQHDAVHTGVGNQPTDVSNRDRLVQGHAQDSTGTPTAGSNGAVSTERTQQQASDTQSVANNNDQGLTQQLRDSIKDDASLSADAKNVQVIMAENTVTLRGTVASQAEKDQLGAKAKQLAGIKNVDNQLQVKQ